MFNETTMRAIAAKLPAATCLSVLCGILVAGLWPFHSPKNDVSWLPTGNGIRLGRYNAIVSAGIFKTLKREDEFSYSLEAWLVPGDNRDAATFVSFYTPDSPFQFLLQQNDDFLMLSSVVPGEQHEIRTSEVELQHVFSRGHPVFITITSGRPKTEVYVNGAWAESFSQFPLSGEACTGQLILGGLAVKRSPWVGELRGLAIYDQELSAAQVLRHYESWTKEGRPDATDDGHGIALYSFDEHAGRIIHNRLRSGMDLYIPERYLVINQVHLEAPWSEYHSSVSYWEDVTINIVGFMPLGWCFYGYLKCLRHVKRSAFSTILFGGIISLTIEILQGFLPTRSSGVTDLITNTLGTSLGVILWRSAVVQSLFAKIGFHWAAQQLSEVHREA